MKRVGRPWVVGEEFQSVGVCLDGLIVVLIGSGISALCNELIELCLPFLLVLLLAGLGLGFRLGFVGGLHEGHGVALSFEGSGVIGHQLERFAERLRSVLVALGGQGGL